MKLFGREVTGYAKTLVILVAVFLVASGLCGLQWSQMDNPMLRGAIGAFLFAAGVVEILAALASAAAIVVVLVLWIIKGLTGRGTA